MRAPSPAGRGKRREKMSETETLSLFDEIESLVSDQLQVVSYKWLSRNFLVSSNTAKRLLKEFIEKRGNGLEVTYTLSGWLKNSPSDYHIRLVSSSKLSEAEKDFNGKYSVQVYSVQASIPTDPAALWNAEFVQAEELFKQPSEVDNCLRNNRFCGISNTFVKRNVEGTVVNVSAPKTNSAATTVQSKSSSSHQEGAVPLNQQKIFQQPSPRISAQLPPIHDQSLKSSSDKEKVPPVPVSKKEGHDQKSLSGTGSSLTNLWDRASLKSKHDSTTTDDKKLMSDLTEAKVQISSHDAIDDGISDDEAGGANFKRASKHDNRKRKVIFDLSDEEYEDAVSLASPGVPKAKSCLDGKQSPKDLGFGEMEIDEPKVKEEDRRKAAIIEPSGVSKNGSSNSPPSEKIQAISSEAKAISKDKLTEPPSSPKRRKVLKTRIDERGREVTEVVWEGEETETKKGKTDAEKKAESNSDAINRPASTKKTPTTTTTGNAASDNAGAKPGNKKGGNARDPKQGNILSFFKRV